MKNSIKVKMYEQYKIERQCGYNATKAYENVLLWLDIADMYKDMGIENWW